MSSVGIGLIAFACLFGAAVLGTLVSARLPEQHQSADTQRIVNLGAGIIGTMAAFILGLLIASAKGSYDTQSNELTVMAAKIALLDRALEVYGPDAQNSRELLRHLVDRTVGELWPNEHTSGKNPPVVQKSNAGQLYKSIDELSAQNDIQRTIKTQATGILTQLAEQRWLILEQRRSSVSKPLLVILIFSLAINFFTFGLFAPRNATVMVTLCVCALASAGAIYLMMEFYHPYGGLIQIPSSTLQNALVQWSQ
jgi:Protein of unknown function (DUF4239)